ncbi:hypothetical protein [Nocardia alni]|uniref:hypothetical protein n=1 Tax=Nocardia alni TaxID=2815723 RepID=UPI001C2402E2|nr:hypothetical protein [Nocardia alni]
MSTIDTRALIAGSHALAQQSLASHSHTLAQRTQTQASQPPAPAGPSRAKQPQIVGQHSAAPAPAVPPAAVRRPPCADGPNDWDLDVGTPDSWRAAVQICQGCPLFAECAELAQNLIERGLAPRSMIWAGVGYDGAGRVVDNLDRHRAAAIDHKRPLRIIRNGQRPLHTGSTSGAPQRFLVLGRRLRPTGAEAV